MEYWEFYNSSSDDDSDDSEDYRAWIKRGQPSSMSCVEELALYQ